MHLREFIFLDIKRFISKKKQILSFKRTWGDLNPRPWDPKSHVMFQARLQALVLINEQS